MKSNGWKRKTLTTLNCKKKIMKTEMKAETANTPAYKFSLNYLVLELHSGIHC